MLTDNIRLIAPDRPGYGKTEYKKNAIEKWPNDILELSEHLGIEKFHLFAPSGGGSYALACAWKIPERLLSVGLFASVGPYCKESIEGVNKPPKLLWRIANPLFGLVKLRNRIGSAYDVTMPKNWKIPLNEIQKKIIIWQAEEACLTGIMSDYLALKLLYSQLIKIPQAGHLWIIENIKTVLEKQIRDSK